MSNRRRFARTWPEYIALYGSVMAAGCALLGCIMVAVMRESPHWVNRGGAAVVALQVVAAIGEYRRRLRLHELRCSTTEADFDPSAKIGRERHLVWLDHEIARSERRALALVLILAGTGEIIHGFGDLLFEGLRCLM